jgi:integrase
MAFMRPRPRADGTTGYAVVYRHEGKESSVTFDLEVNADKFLTAVNTLGPERALKAFGIGPTKKSAAKPPGGGLTIADWVATHIDGLSGIAKSTEYDYRTYLRRDIGPALGAIPVTALTRADVAGWVDAMFEAGSSGKTIANKHGLLSAALAGAVAAGHITANPAAGTRLPRSEKVEMVFLTTEEFQQLRAGFTAHWLPLVDFMVATGARFGEIAALRPTDVDRGRGTVHIGRAMKRTYDAERYEIGPTKTAGSARTISVGSEILEALDYGNTTLFVTTKGGPLRIASWRANVWYKSVERAQARHGLLKQPRIHDMRHTCASWMIAAGIPLPVVQAHLGHEDISTTVRLYTHIDRRQADAAAAVMAAALRPVSRS